MEQEKCSKENKEKQNLKQGFTLLELLVVIIIIGVLAAIALPQYRLAVDKSRVAKYIDMGRSIRQAQERFYMAHDEYAYDFGKLDIEYDPSCKTNIPNIFYNCMGGDVEIDNMASGENSLGVVRMFYCPSLSGVKQNSYLDCPNAAELEMGFYFAYYNYAEKRNKIICYKKTARGERICKALGF